jgi:hypothetical protein
MYRKRSPEGKIKLSITPAWRRQEVTGLVDGKRPSVSRARPDAVRAAIHQPAGSKERPIEKQSLPLMAGFFTWANSIPAPLDDYAINLNQ